MTLYHNLRPSIFALLIVLFGLMTSQAETIEVEPGENIQAAVDRAKPGDTIQVAEGTYKGSLVIDKQLNIEGIGMPVIDARGDDIGITLLADGCTIRGFEIINSGESGITVYSDGNKLVNNTLRDNSDGIYLYESDGNSIYGNYARGSGILGAGILLEISSDNIIEGNDIRGSGRSTAIQLYDSCNNNTIVENRAKGGWIGSGGIMIGTSCCNNVIQGNDAEGSRLGEGIVLLYGCDNNTIIHNKSRGGRFGNGIATVGSCGNIIAENMLTDSYIGIYLSDMSDNNTLERNSISRNKYGIGLLSSQRNTIRSNLIEHSGDQGIGLLTESKGNIIDGNEIRGNGCGIYMQDSSNNTIYRNVLADNDESIRSSNSTNNWSSPWQVDYEHNGRAFRSRMGNSWSDYSGADSNGDGIGDRPHLFEGGMDEKPLMEPYAEYEIEGGDLWAGRDLL